MRRLSWSVLVLVIGCGGVTPEPVAPAPIPEPPPAPPPAPAPASSAERGPTSDMSLELGGLRLGMTAEELTRACESKGGEILSNPADRDLLCMDPPAPLVFGGAPLPGGINAKFCGVDARVCSLSLGVEGGPEDADRQREALVAMLTQRYGAPQRATGEDGRDLMTRCVQSGARVDWFRSWRFGPEQSPSRPLGRVNLGFACDPRPMHTLYLAIENEAKVREHIEKLGDRSE